MEGDDVADLWDDLGSNWRIFEQYFKAYPVCRWAQPPVQAVMDLRAEHGLTSEDVERIEVVTFHQSLRLATRRPTTTEQAQYSTAFPVAVGHGPRPCRGGGGGAGSIQRSRDPASRRRMIVTDPMTTMPPFRHAASPM